MDCPELYVEDNDLQRRDATDLLNKFIGKMIWKPNEIILDVGCGPGDVTFEILFSLLKNKTAQLIGVDKSRKMIEYAKKTYGISNKIHFEVLDIENSNECQPYSSYFDKLFSNYCFNWVPKKFDALVNMHKMLKKGGEILIQYLIVIPWFEFYECLDAKWKKYIDSLRLQYKSENFCSHEEVEAIFIKAGFQIIQTDSSVKNYTFPDYSSLLNTMRPVDEMYNVLPPSAHDEYSMHVKEKIRGHQMFDICPTTGKVTMTYQPITVHAKKI